MSWLDVAGVGAACAVLGVWAGERLERRRHRRVERLRVMNRALFDDLRKRGF